MPVLDQATANSYTGNGVATVYPYTFKLLDERDLLVEVDNVVQTLTTHYTVSGVGNPGGGNVTFVTAPPNGDAVEMSRNMEFARATDYQENGDLQASTLDEDVDRVVMLTQQVRDQQSAGTYNFIQSGAGAVTRTVQNKLRDEISIADFGAAGDGVTDDSAADAAARVALDAAGGGTLRYPPATGYLIGGEVRQPGELIIDADFPAYSGDEPAGPFRVYAAAAEGVGKIAGSFIITNGAAIPFNTLGTGDSCAVSGWGYRDTGGTNPMVVANFGARIENNLGAITWGVEIDINNEGATQSINDPAGGEALVINTGSTYSPSTGIRIRRATGEGTGPGYLRGIMIDGVREQAITCVAMEAASFPGMSPAAPGTLNILTSYKSADTNVRFQMNESGAMVWGSGSAATDTLLSRTNGGGLTLDTPMTASAFKVGANQVVGARDTGWVAMTGTSDESTAYATSTVTLPQLAGRVAALQAALTTHGLIGA